MHSNYSHTNVLLLKHKTLCVPWNCPWAPISFSNWADGHIVTHYLTCLYWSPVPQPLFLSASMSWHSLHPPATQRNDSHDWLHTLCSISNPQGRPPFKEGCTTCHKQSQYKIFMSLWEPPQCQTDGLISFSTSAKQTVLLHINQHTILTPDGIANSTYIYTACWTRAWSATGASASQPAPISESSTSIG
jgi:hypothetical protein